MSICINLILEASEMFMSLQSNSSKLLCLSWLPATLMMIRSKMNELAWRQHFPLIIYGNFFRQSGAANSVVSAGWNSNSSKILCMFSLPTSIKRIRSKTTEKRWRHCFPHYTVSQWGLSLPWQPEFWSNLPLLQPFPHPSDTYKLIKTGQLASEIFKFESVNDSRWRTIGIL